MYDSATTLNVDNGLVIQSLKKAKRENHPQELKWLINHLLGLADAKKLKIDLDVSFLMWKQDKTTYLKYNSVLMNLLKERLNKEGVKVTNAFCVNLLLYNYLKS